MRTLISVVCVLVLYVSASAAFAAGVKEVGVGLKLGKAAKTTNLDAVKNNISSISSTSSLSESSMFLGADIFFEHNFNERFALGGKLGYETVGKDELSFRIRPPSSLAGRYNLKMEQNIFPLSVYGKLNIFEFFNIYGGGGLSWAFSTFKDGPQKYKDNKIFPHLVFGAEVRVSRAIGLGVDFKYSKNAKLDGHGYPKIFSKDIVDDLNGLSWGVQFRYYFEIESRKQPQGYTAANS
ncbi:MAG: porin family protein [Syntrophomonadaceae bacterium]|jgi:hypothetical protein|nr:porin family protein [Syntrophomonadaceae bacterium]